MILEMPDLEGIMSPSSLYRDSDFNPLVRCIQGNSWCDSLKCIDQLLIFIFLPLKGGTIIVINTCSIV